MRRVNLFAAPADDLKMSNEKRPAGPRRYLPFAIIALVLVGAVVGGALMFRSTRTEPSRAAGGGLADAPFTAATPTPRRGPPQPGAQPPRVRGETGAPVTLEEFGDFECPPCGRLHPELKKIEHDYGANLRVIFRHLPLTRIHKHARDAARAAEAAALQGRFWEMHDLLYENQAEWSAAADARAVFAGYARRLNLDTGRFLRDMDSMEVNSRITADLERANSLGITGTPTLLLDGRELSENWTLQSLRADIDAAIARSGQPKR